MRITPELMRKIDSKVLDPQVRVLLFKIIEASDPKVVYTEYDDLQDGVMNAYDEGFREGQTKMANDLLKFIDLIVQ